MNLVYVSKTMNSMSSLTLVRPQMRPGNVKIQGKMTKHLAADRVHSNFEANNNFQETKKNPSSNPTYIDS